jgi:hypothetical protein
MSSDGCLKPDVSLTFRSIVCNSPGLSSGSASTAKPPFLLILSSFGRTFKPPLSARVVQTLRVNLDTWFEPSPCLPDLAVVAVELVMADGSMYARAVISDMPICEWSLLDERTSRQSYGWEKSWLVFLSDLALQGTYRVRIHLSSIQHFVRDGHQNWSKVGQRRQQSDDVCQELNRALHNTLLLSLRVGANAI